MNLIGGLEFDENKIKKKRWLWFDTTTCHVPPFQPIKLVVNNNISVKVLSFDKICIEYICENQVCKFRVGSKIKV